MAEKATAAPPLTVEIVCEAVQGVEWTVLGEWLIPSRKYDEMKQLWDTSNEDRLRAVVECWLGGGHASDREPTWRSLIWTLDAGGQTRVADKIRHFAEPVLDPSLTVENVTEVMREVGDWERVARGGFKGDFSTRGLEIPDCKLQEIKQQSYTKRDRSRLVGEYWVNTDPNPSWRCLADALYEKGEDNALLMVKQYLPKADSTLTTDNLMEVVKGVEDRWDDLGVWLGVPDSKRNEISRFYHSDQHRMQALADHYTTHFPTPSWNKVARALQGELLHKQADEVTTKYVKARSKELFDEAMKDGYVEARDIKALIFGAAGTGKSHTIALIMDEEPPSVRHSTPCATRPVRATRAAKRGEKWVKVTREELSQTIADTATMLPLKTSTSKNSKTSAASATSTASGTSKPQNDCPTTTDSSSSKEGVTAPSITRGKVSSGSTSAEDELLRRIEMSPQFRYQKKTFKGDRILLIDTGGQPQFHEVLPIFMQGTSASMFTIKLNDSLSDHPLIEYYDNDGKLVGTPYHSAFTNQQILSHCMRVIQAQASQSEEGLCPNAIFMGTHKDLENDCKDESREEKNLKIHEMLLPAVQEEAIYCSEEFKELIFPLDVKNPGPQEQEFAAKLRRLIVERSHVKPKRIPLRWDALELALQKRMLELGRGVLSKGECFAVAQRFHFDEESFEEALKYLHSLNVLFYYDDILPDIVFCDPMVLLDKITELVEHSHRTSTDPSQLTPTVGKLRKFHTQGIVTLELLSNKEFVSHYVPGVFGPEELLKLFKKLLIVSPISEEEYLMPCLLPVADDPSLLSPSGSVPSLLLYFPHSALVGVFCALAAYLLSEAKWKLLFNTDRSPVKVDRNSIEFQVPGDLPGKIILTDSFSTYFCICLQLPRNAPAALCSQVCPQIRETIMAGLRKASATLHYNNCVPRDAFLCGEHSDSTTSPHATVVDGSRTVMTCSRNPAEVCTVLTEQHLAWFGSQRSAGAVKLTTPDAVPEPILKELVKVKVKSWYNLGLQLNIEDYDLQTIERNNPQDQEGCKRAMFRIWLNNSPQASYKQLLQALVELDDVREADHLHKKYGIDMPQSRLQ